MSHKSCGSRSHRVAPCLPFVCYDRGKVLKQVQAMLCWEARDAGKAFGAGLEAGERG